MYRDKGMRRLLSRALTELQSPAYSTYLRMRGFEIGQGCRFLGLPYFLGDRDGRILLGDRVTLVSSSVAAPLSVSNRSALRLMAPGARIVVGADSGITGSVIASRMAITIGARVLIGSGCMITDSDWHPLDTVPRRYEVAPEPSESDSVTIGDDVFLGARTIVLKGVTIGEGTVVGSGSVVTRSLPPRVVAAGVPARVVRELNLD